MSLLPLASNIVITGGSFVQNNDATKDLMPLYDKVAPHAILNSGGRADPVRCHPGTREEVIGKMEKRIADNDPGDRGVFWLSGPAGAGKSAIMQTVAERCIKRKVPMVNFFFFRADGTRNHSDSVVATILFQLFKIFPMLKAHVAAIAAENPVIFRETMREQFLTLIETPLIAVSASPHNTPLVILIDGLDECSSGNGKADQVCLLNILHDTATRSISPGFIILVASRTEAHIATTFNEIGCHPDSIYLDKSYRPSTDIRKFLIDEFSKIKRTHILKDTLPQKWPSSYDLDAIVRKSSGQFVFPTTVTRFISTSAASPKRSLEIVMGLRLPTRTSPFSTLDSLYSYILSQAEDWNSVRDILASENIYASVSQSLGTARLLNILHPLGYTEDDILSCLADLTAIIRYHAGDRHLTVYHASLNDFLCDKARSKGFHVDTNVFACRLVELHFRQSTTRSDLYYSFRILEDIVKPDKQLTDFFAVFLPDPKLFQQQNVDSNFQWEWMGILDKLYRSRNPVFYQSIRKKWEEWFRILDRLSQASKDGSMAEPGTAVSKAMK